MGLVDIIIIGFIVLGGFIGFKRGVVKEFVSAIGLVLITVLSFILKNPLSILFYENLPFFKFGGVFKGVTVLNIVLYEFIAFLLIFLLLMILWKVVLFASSIIQKIINMTIILGFPSKILGFVIGLIEFYFIGFVVLYILTLPLFNIKGVNDSSVGSFVLNDTPVISGFVKNNTGFIDEFVSLKDKYKNSESATEFNYETLDLFLKYDIIKADSVNKLVEKNKLKMDGVDELINKYRK